MHFKCRKGIIGEGQRLTRTKTRLTGADAIYANNKNRSFATEYNIEPILKEKEEQKNTRNSVNKWLL